jgi:hypothetical protein
MAKRQNSRLWADGYVITCDNFIAATIHQTPKVHHIAMPEEYFAAIEERAPHLNRRATPKCAQVTAEIKCP